MWRMQHWELHTHGGFLTYQHHDAAGLLTYTYPMSGAKIWIFIRPELKDYKSRKDLFADYDVLGYHAKYGSIGTMGTILLQPGDFLHVYNPFIKYVN
jgi:hypothetical protein